MTVWPWRVQIEGCITFRAAWLRESRPIAPSVLGNVEAWRLHEARRASIVCALDEERSFDEVGLGRAPETTSERVIEIARLKQPAPRAQSVSNTISALLRRLLTWPP